MEASTRTTDYPLAIYSYGFGARTETFIRRHVRDLLTGRTLAIGRVIPESEERDWDIQGPLLDLDSIRDLHSIKRFLLDHNVRVMMGEYLDDSLYWLDIAQALGMKFFGHAHGYDVSERLREAKWRKEYLRYGETGGVITMSEASRVKLIDIGLPSSKVHVVPYGVDVPDRPLERPHSKRMRLAAVGRMVAKKGAILTLDAFRRVSKDYDDLYLQYVGAGNLLPAAKQYVQAFQLEKKVHLYGSQPNEFVKLVLRGADVFVQHSMADPETGDEEGLPVAILEAMANALPVVSTRHAGIPEAVVDGVTGYLVEEGDSEAMAECITLLIREPERRRAMGLAGWSRAKNLFAWEGERDRLLKILELQSKDEEAKSGEVIG